jgi:hypothetical protein
LGVFLDQNEAELRSDRRDASIPSSETTTTSEFSSDTQKKRKVSKGGRKPRNQPKIGRKPRKQSKAKASQADIKCETCGLTDHLSETCRYRNETSKSCGAVSPSDGNEALLHSELCMYQTVAQQIVSSNNEFQPEVTASSIVKRHIDSECDYCAHRCKQELMPLHLEKCAFKKLKAQLDNITQCHGCKLYIRNEVMAKHRCSDSIIYCD